MREKVFTFALTILLLFSLTGCSLTTGEEFDTQEAEATGPYLQTSTLGISETDKDFESRLVSGTYYVVQDGVYYPAFSWDMNYAETDELKKYALNSHQMYFLSENEQDIPTLYLESDAMLVYYDAENVFDYTTYERYFDLDYTVGLYNLNCTEMAHRYYIDTDNEDGYIVEGAGLDEILDTIVTDNITLSNIGGVKIDDSVVENNLISGCIKDATYDLELYGGTQYFHFLADANVHAFRAAELYGSSVASELKTNIWEIEIPDYLPTGYYRLVASCVEGSCFSGMVRIVRTGSSFENLPEVFNEQKLFPAEDDENKLIYGYTEEDNLKSLFPYTTNRVGSLGYDTGVEKVPEEEKKEALRPANTREFLIAFPEDTECTVSVIPTNREKGGDIYLLWGDRKLPLTYNAIDNAYRVAVSGDGNTYTLCVSGLWKDYSISLSGCTQNPTGVSASVISEEQKSSISFPEFKAANYGGLDLENVLPVNEETDTEESAEE